MAVRVPVRFAGRVPALHEWGWGGILILFINGKNIENLIVFLPKSSKTIPPRWLFGTVSTVKHFSFFLRRALRLESCRESRKASNLVFCFWIFFGEFLWNFLFLEGKYSFFYTKVNPKTIKKKLTASGGRSDASVSRAFRSVRGLGCVDFFLGNFEKKLNICSKISKISKEKKNTVLINLDRLHLLILVKVQVPPSDAREVQPRDPQNCVRKNFWILEKKIVGNWGFWNENFEK